MPEESKSPTILEKESEWTPIPTLPPTTVPKWVFILYFIYTVLLLVIYIPYQIVTFIFHKLFLAPIHWLMFYIPNSFIKPIKASPENYVILTGASSGIGKEMTKIYASKGFSLILIDINANALNSFKNELEKEYSNQIFKTIVIDLSQQNCGEIIYNYVINEWKINTVKILVNNAGFGYSGDFCNQSKSKLLAMIDVNVRACVDLAHLFVKYFIKRGEGRICQIASVAGYLPGPHESIYHGTKAFVKNWALALRYELMGTGVTVTVICPGAVATNFAKVSDATQAFVFGLKNLVYTPEYIAAESVKATLNGDGELMLGPLWKCLQMFLTNMGQTYNMMSSKLMWQSPTKNVRSIYTKYEYKN